MITPPPPPPTHYSAFGNRHLNDCSIAAAANLTQYHDPEAHITTNEVVRAWRATRPPNFTTGLTYLLTTGFDNNRITNFTLLTTRAQFITAANTTGVYDILTWNHTAHAIAVVAASPRGVTSVWWGVPTFQSWVDFGAMTSTPYGVTWATA